MRHIIHSDVVIPVAESYSDCFELIRSDLYRIYGRRIESVLKLWLYHFKEPSSGFLFYYRLCSHRGILWPYCRLRLEKYIRKYALQIPLSAHIGYGLYLGHNTGIIVNGSATIGSNVNLSQFSTIGSMKAAAGTVEDEAYLGPNVCLVEQVRVGRRAMVGAGAIVTRDIPAGASAAGVPARVLNENAGYSPVNMWPVADIKSPLPM